MLHICAIHFPINMALAVSHEIFVLRCFHSSQWFLACFCFFFFLMIFLFSWLFKSHAFNFLLFFYVCVVYRHVCHACVEAVWCPALSLPTDSFETASLTETWSKAGSQQAAEILLPLLPQPWGYKSLCVQSHSAFYVGTADVNLGFQACAPSVLTHWTISFLSLLVYF